MREIIFILATHEKESLYSVRAIPNLEVANFEGDIWIKTNSVKEDLSLELLKLPVKETLVLNQENLLFPQNGITPIKTLPELTWKSISDFTPIIMPTSAFPGKTDKACNLSLVKSNDSRSGEALLTSLEIWKKYGESASEVRLERLEFAVSSKDEVLIVGNPLPPIPGKEYWKKGTLFFPSGYELELNSFASNLENKINRDLNSIILFDEQGQWSTILNRYFVKARRSAIRLTAGIAEDEEFE